MSKSSPFGMPAAAMPVFDARTIAARQAQLYVGLMRYLSTRDTGRYPATHGFEAVLLAGLAADGGLYVPEQLPVLDRETLTEFSGLPYAVLAARILALFAGDAFDDAELAQLTERAYGDFRHAAVAPLVQLDERLWLLELFHGPTLAFKDLALQLVGLMFDAVLGRRGDEVTIIGATSGDTGSAALAACRDKAALDIFMLYPQARISEVQRRQMTTVDAPNAYAVAIEGTFDDCQDIVKALFADPALRRELNLSAVNSINFARVATQIVYYFAAGLALGAPARTVSFSVPTGNFGNVYAGHLARALGLPIERLVIGTNANDTLARYLATGDMSIAPVVASLSPSMDIQVASNFERLLFELKGRSGGAVAADLRQFRETGSLPPDEQAWRRAGRLFSGHRVDDAQTLAAIGDTYRRTGRLIDPHTAIAVAAARAGLARQDSTSPIVALATAHPAKFPDAVERATGIRPPVPASLAEIIDKPERITVLPNDAGAVARYLRAHARRARPNRGAA
jgi:threonine synthase